MITIHESRVETFLSANDFERFLNLVKERHTTRAALAREAILWYLNNHQTTQQTHEEAELSQTLRNMTNRICGMLARQGVQVGTLFELAWQNHTDNNMQERFISATNTVKQNMRKRLSEDERIVAEKMRGVVG